MKSHTKVAKKSNRGMKRSTQLHTSLRREKKRNIKERHTTKQKQKPIPPQYSYAHQKLNYRTKLLGTA